MNAGRPRQERADERCLTWRSALVTLTLVGKRRFKIVLCRGPECGDQRSSQRLVPALRLAMARHPDADVALDMHSCFGRCSQGPNVLVREIVETPLRPTLGTGFATVPGPRGATALYNRVDASRVERIVAEHVAGGRIVREFIEMPTVAAPTTGETPP